MAAVRWARARDELVPVVHRTTGVDRFGRDVLQVLQRAVPFDGVGLWTVDPATLLPTGLIVRRGLDLDLLPRFIEIELGEPDFIKFRTLARQDRAAASLSDATRGDLDRSVRHCELIRPQGFDDELRVVFSDWAGASGAVCLLREPGRHPFEAREVDFLASLAPLVAEGLRRAAILGEVATVEQGGTAVVVLAPDNSIETATTGAERLLADLGNDDTPGGQLPVAVLAVAARARRIARDDHTDLDRRAPRSDMFARARVHTAQGNWVTVRGSVLGDDPYSSVAVLIEEARPPELAPLIADAYGLTDRERRVTELVAQGLSTNEIGQRLHVSSYTVQDHLKSIFDKTGAGSRGELVARLFFDHYAPRLQTTEPD
ncbi:helix-turn-helix transcriptional regulator [Mycolicibacterium sp. XJ870]